MNVVSAFDGMSCGQIALNKLGINIERYFAFEIDKNAIKVTNHNYPNTIQMGNVEHWSYLNKNFIGSTLIFKDHTEIYCPKVDLLIGGSPCQDISNLSKFKLGLDGNKSSLFYHYWRMWQETKPKYFLLENVAGNKA